MPALADNSAVKGQGERSIWTRPGGHDVSDVHDRLLKGVFAMLEKPSEYVVVSCPPRDMLSHVGHVLAHGV